MKRALLALFLPLVLFSANVTYKGITFTDYEQEVAEYILNYNSYGQFTNNIYFSSQISYDIVFYRKDTPIFFNDINLVSSNWSSIYVSLLRAQTHNIEYSRLLTDLGISVRDKNFLLALTSILISFTAFIAFILMVI